jgi:methylmalonyl-CoA mutase
MQGLFSEFPSSSYSDWEKQVIKDLKGETPEHLFWENENGFRLSPYYAAENCPIPYEPAFAHIDWQVGVYHSGSAKEMNASFLRDLNHGANAIAFELKEHNLEELLNGIQLDLISVSITLQATQAPTLKKYLDTHYKGKPLNLSLFPVSLSNEKELEEWASLQVLFADNTGIKTVSVDAIAFSSRGALPNYELVLAFTQLIENLSLSEATSVNKTGILIKTSTDTDFFVQIAKLRAYRRLWKLIAKEYNITSQLYILSETDINSLSISDAYTNLLRTTLSSMAAILGGCNELIVLPYDRLLLGDSAFSSRMAMNQQFILKHESYFDKMGDVACGSYYIERLTDALCEKALAGIKAMESKGGYFKSLAAGEINQELEKQNKSKLEAISSGKSLRVGVNKFKNEKEKLDLNEEQLYLLKSLAPHHPLLNYELFQTLKP